MTFLSQGRPTSKIHRLQAFNAASTHYDDSICYAGAFRQSNSACRFRMQSAAGVCFRWLNAAINTPCISVSVDTIDLYQASGHRKKLLNYVGQESCHFAHYGRRSQKDSRKLKLCIQGRSRLLSSRPCPVPSAESISYVRRIWYCRSKSSNFQLNRKRRRNEKTI